MTIVYSNDAIGDLQRLRAFVAEKNPGAAGRIACEIVARVERLAQFPRMGRATRRTIESTSLEW